MGKADFVGGLAIAAFGLLLIFVVIPMGTEDGAYYGLSPTFFPTFVAAAITLSAVGLTIQGWLRLRAGDPRPMPITKWNLMMFLIAAAIAIAGVMAIEFVGLVVAAPAMIAAYALFLGERNFIRITLASTVPVGLIYMMATHVLRTPLP